MANPQSGFQANSTIHSAWWIFRPDPTVDPVSKETIVEVNGIQYIEANAAVVLASVSATQVTSNVVTATVTTTGQMRPGQIVILSGLTNSTFLNGQLLTITSTTPTSFAANFTNADYGLTAEPAGAQVIDTTHRMCDLYYAESTLATTQQPRKLQGPVAAQFLWDMEQLFY
jgi:hypothetical protein